MFPPRWELAGTGDGIGRGVAALGQGRERDRVPSALRHRGGLPEGTPWDFSSIEVARRLGVKRQTAWLIKRKMMRAMNAREAEKPKLAGRVEVDGAYLGGKRGRGAAGKTPIVAAVERRSRRLRLSVVKGFRKKEVARLAERDFAAGSNVVSDGLSCWPAVEKAGCQHFPMVTGSGKRAAVQVGQHLPGQHARPRSPAPTTMSAPSMRSRTSPASPTASIAASSSTASSSASPGPPSIPTRSLIASLSRMRDPVTQVVHLA
ncbi:MAG: IS1595 family transposase [Geminicoccaceae bacterium]